MCHAAIRRQLEDCHQLSCCCFITAGASGATRRETRSRKVSQRMAIVDESTRKQVGRGMVAQQEEQHSMPQCYATAGFLSPPTYAASACIASCLPQAVQSRLDALENDNADDAPDPFGLADGDDDEFVMQDSDEDGEPPDPGSRQQQQQGWQQQSGRDSSGGDSSRRTCTSTAPACHADSSTAPRWRTSQHQQRCRLSVSDLTCRRG